MADDKDHGMHAFSVGEPSSTANAQERIPLSPLGSPHQSKNKFFPDIISMEELVKRQTCPEGETTSDHLGMLVPQPVRFSESEGFK